MGLTLSVTCGNRAQRGNNCFFCWGGGEQGVIYLAHKQSNDSFNYVIFLVVHILWNLSSTLND